MPRAADLRLDEEEVRAVLRAERAESASGGGRRGDGDFRTGPADRLDAQCHEIVADRCAVRLGEHVVDLVLRRRGDALEDLRRIVVPSLDALEIQDREATEL